MYRLRTTFLTCLLALLYIVMQAQETTDGNVARKAIAEIALEICPNISGNYDYYVSNETVSDPTANGSTVEGRYWMVFVDMAPLANWDHPCKYIYIKENSMTADGTTIVEDSNRPPRGIKMSSLIEGKSRPAITVDVVGKDENGVAYLVAENVSEKVGYSWMDKDGILIGTTEKVRYTGGDITLRLTAMSDGAIAEFDCSDVQVADNVSIEKIQDGFSVKFKEPVEEETTIKVATISNMSDQRVYKLSKGEKQKDVNTNGMSVNKDSYYSISVFQKNTCISNKKVK